MEKYGVPPSPGSEEAIALGCTCPVMDNCRGKGMYEKDGYPVFVYNMACPIHGFTLEETCLK